MTKHEDQKWNKTATIILFNAMSRRFEYKKYHAAGLKALSLSARITLILEINFLVDITLARCLLIIRMLEGTMTSSGQRYAPQVSCSLSVNSEVKLWVCSDCFKSLCCCLRTYQLYKFEKCFHMIARFADLRNEKSVWKLHIFQI